MFTTATTTTIPTVDMRQVFALVIVLLLLNTVCFAVSPNILLDGIEPKVSQYLHSFYILSAITTPKNVHLYF